MRLRTLLATILLGGGSTAAVQAAAVPPEVDEALIEAPLKSKLIRGSAPSGFECTGPNRRPQRPRFL